MSPAPRIYSTRKPVGGYLERTHRPLNCLVFVLPLLVAYEVGAIFYADRLAAPQDLAWFMGLFGATWRFTPAVLIVLVLGIWHVAAKEKWHVDADAVGGMAAESLVLWIPLLGINMLLVRLLIPPQASSAPAVACTLAAGGSGPYSEFGLATGVLQEFGAAVYEEFLFRLVGINLILFVAVDLLKLKKKYVIPPAIVVLSVLFGLAHLGDPDATLPVNFRFMFRAVAALYLSAVFVARGFGVAVGAHACHNIAWLLLEAHKAG